MQHSRGLSPGETRQNADPSRLEDSSGAQVRSQPERSDLMMADRTSPPWALVLSALFTTGSLTCLFAVAVLGMFFVKIVAQGGEIYMIPILTGLGLTFMAGLIVLEFAHTKALAGYRSLREQHAHKTAAWVAAVVFALLTLIHPLAGLAIPASGLVSGGAYFLLSQRKRLEPMWDFLPSEVPSVLAGRDKVGLGMTRSTPQIHAMGPATQYVTQGITVIFALGLGSYLTGVGVLAPAAIVPLALVTLWAGHGLERFARDYFTGSDALVQPLADVHGYPDDQEVAPAHMGLQIRRLNLRDQNGRPLLSNVDIDIEPGTITGVMGESGAGKSVLLQAIADPFSFFSSEVSGSARLGGVNLWDRRAGLQSVPAVYLPDRPVLLPASGAENLTCFQVDKGLDRGQQILEQLTFATDIAEQICSHPNALLLPTTQARLLTLARAFFIAPQLYLLDRPEDGLPERQLKAVIARMQQETQLGRSFLIVSSDRSVLNACDQIMIMLHGQVVDHGDAKEMRDRIAGGWERFIGQRQLTTEDSLTRWIHSHFQRGPEKVNKRRVCQVASEMLMLSCQNADPLNPGHLRFTFKHFEGHCVLQMEDDAPPITASQLELARQQVREKTLTNKKLPLAAILEQTLDLETQSDRDSRILTVKIKTFDPRKGAAGPVDETEPT